MVLATIHQAGTDGPSLVPRHPPHGNVGRRSASPRDDVSMLRSDGCQRYLLTKRSCHVIHELAYTPSPNRQRQRKRHTSKGTVPGGVRRKPSRCEVIMAYQATSNLLRTLSYLVPATLLAMAAVAVEGNSVAAHSAAFSRTFEEVNKTCTVNAEADPVEMMCTSFWKSSSGQPESVTSSLSLSRSVGPGTFSNEEVLDKDIVFECNVVFPTSVEQDVMLFNHGAGGRGTWVGLMAEGVNGLPVMTGRAGDGGRLPRSGTARFETADIPLDGKVHNVVVDIRIQGPGRIRLFIDGALKAQGVSSNNALLANQFSGGSNPAYGSGGSTPNGKPNRAWPGFPETLTSELKIYDNGQLVP